MQRRFALLALSAAVAAGGTAGGALADSVTTFNEVIPVSGCSPLRELALTAPARIAVDAMTWYGGTVRAEVVAADGVFHPEPFDAMEPGTYGVRVCGTRDWSPTAALPFSAVITVRDLSTRTVGAVAGVSATLPHVAVGWGAVRTNRGLAWFWVRAATNGNVRVQFHDGAHGVHVSEHGTMKARFDGHRAQLTGNGLTITLVDRGKRDLVRVTSAKYRISSSVVRGGLRVS